MRSIKNENSMLNHGRKTTLLVSAQESGHLDERLCAIWNPGHEI